MTSVVLIDKVGNKKKTNIKNFDLNLLYKKCNFRNNTNFEKRHTWKIKEHEYVSVYAKDKGRSNNINKFDLPPPVDNVIYYGSIIVVKHNTTPIKNENVEDIDLDEWEKIYEKLFGGFEDLNDEDSFSEEEDIPEHLKTKQGYSKEDGFVVSDDDEDEDYNPEDSSEISEYDSNDNMDDDNEADDEDSVDYEEDEEEDEEEDDDEESDEEDEDDDDMYGSELSEEEYIDE